MQTMKLHFNCLDVAPFSVVFAWCISERYSSQLLYRLIDGLIIAVNKTYLKRVFYTSARILSCYEQAFWSSWGLGVSRFKPYCVGRIILHVITRIGVNYC